MNPVVFLLSLWFCRALTVRVVLGAPADCTRQTATQVLEVLPGMIGEAAKAAERGGWER